MDDEQVERTRHAILQAMEAAGIDADEDDHLLYIAWTIIANAGGGDWSRESPDWREAASRWRDRFHARIDARRPAPRRVVVQPVERGLIVCETDARDGDGYIVVTLCEPFRTPVEREPVIVRDDRTGVEMAGRIVRVEADQGWVELRIAVESEA